jgi:energy-coupling factor transport system permease protein
MPIYRYIEGQSFFHRVHPAVKVFALFIMFWSVYWVDNPLALMPLGILMLIAARLTGAWPNFYRLRWFFVILVATTTIMWLFFYQRGTPLFTIPLFQLRARSFALPFSSRTISFGGHPVGLSVTGLSIVFGVGRGLKLAELLAASVLFLSTTKVEEFTVGLNKLHVPYRFGFAISLAFRLAALFGDSAATIVDAQRLRGYNFNEGGPLERMRRYVPVAVPVFMGALRKANNMAMALEARGFGNRVEPTTFIDYPVRRSDRLAFAGLILLGAFHFMLYYTGLGAIGPSTHHPASKVPAKSVAASRESRSPLIHQSSLRLP